SGWWDLHDDRWTPIAFTIPPGRPTPAVTFSAVPELRPFAVRLQSARISGIRHLTPAERVTAGELFQGEPPGVVDNLYVTWIFEYGIFAVLPLAAWLGLLLGLIVGRSASGT